MLLLLTATPMSRAATTTLPFDDPGELASWTVVTEAPGSIVLGGGELRIANGKGGLAEYVGYEGSTRTVWDHVRDERGWWVEAELGEVTGECAGAFLWVGTPGRQWLVGVGGEVVVDGYDGSTVADWPAEGGVLQLRAEVDGTASLWIDGERAGKSLQPASGTAGIVLGQADDCQGSARWESLTLSDLYWGMEGGDEDGDGIVNDTDVCIFDADPDQVDTDGDGKGDACDPCPLDALDDRDGDGVCDSDDATPDGDPGDEGYYDSEPHPVDTLMDQGGCGCGTGARAPVLALVLAAAAIGRRSRG